MILDGDIQMVRIIFTWIVFAQALISTSVFALEPTELMLEYNSKSLGWLGVNTGTVAHDMRVVIDDQVTDGCWTSKKASKTSVVLKLKRSGFNTA